MRVRWFGQSAFLLQGSEGSVAIDPFDDLSGLASRGIQFDYPAITGVEAQLLLVTHEHADHNGVEVIGGEPTVLRSTAGRLESPIGEVLAVASEHGEHAGTERGPNTIFVFELDGARVDEQEAAIGKVDVLFIPVGGGPTIGAEQAAQIVERVGASVVVPMHYRTPRIGFLESADGFLERYERVERLDVADFDSASLPQGDGPLVVVPAAP
jgi:L-ascorbate metabolism protein UlaG (beta-lactamase superfamily)